MSEHEEICIKVNAYVDKKIARVIEAINNNFDGIITKYSCEDNRSEIEKEDNYPPRAYVRFSYKDDSKNWKLLASHCNAMAIQLKSIPYAEVQIIWNEGFSVGQLEFLTENTDDIASSLNQYHFTDKEI